jgi:hypothetical protein
MPAPNIKNTEVKKIMKMIERMEPKDIQVLLNSLAFYFRYVRKPIEDSQAVGSLLNKAAGEWFKRKFHK